MSYLLKSKRQIIIFKTFFLVSGRSNTWPVVVVNLGKNGPTTQLDANFNERTPLDSTLGPASSCAGTILDSRRVATLSRRYYPEGGWGWVTLGCCVVVQVLNHGLQLSFGMLIVPVNVIFFSVYQYTGKVLVCKCDMSRGKNGSKTYSPYKVLYVET